MDRPTARLLGLEGNFALAQVEGRRFPGFLIQGDTLRSLQVSVRELEDSLRTQDAELTAATLEEVVEMVDAMIDSYERMMTAEALELPYIRPE